MAVLFSAPAFAAPATKAPADLRPVRVLISENKRSADVRVKGAYTVKALPSLALVKKGEDLKGSFSADAKGIWFDKKVWPVRGLRIEPARDRELFLDERRFRGIIDVYKDPKTQTLYAVNHLDVEVYLYGVLHHEVAHWWPMEALKAQAVAARTYALYQASVSKPFDFDLKSGTASQVYGGSTVERFRTKRAVDQTRGRVLTWQGKLFPAYFHATCAGLTARASELWNIDLPPLKGGVACDYCRLSPHYRWHAKVPLSQIEERMIAGGRPVGRVLKIEPITQTPSSRIGTLRIAGTAGETIMAAKDFRVWVGGERIRSTFFHVKVHDDTAEFQGEGWGHGVGLCQWGTLGQALLNRSCDTILKFYYPGAEIENVK